MARFDRRARRSAMNAMLAGWQRGMRYVAALAALSLASGCASVDRDAHADALAGPAGLHREVLTAGDFRLTVFSRITRPDKPLRIYIEGDGLAWVSRSEPSLDPTPVAATGLALAAPEVIESMNAAVDQLVARTPGQPVELVGYSGGGAIAVLIAARRHDVAALRTVAGNLDTEYINRLHHVSPMPASRNPIDVARRIAGIAQIHFSSAQDTIVPPDVARRFAAAAGGSCVTTVTVRGVAHDGDWAQHWRELLAQVPVCRDR